MFVFAMCMIVFVHLWILHRLLYFYQPNTSLARAPPLSYYLSPLATIAARGDFLLWSQIDEYTQKIVLLHTKSRNKHEWSATLG